MVLVALAGWAGGTHPDSEGVCGYAQYIPTDAETTTYPAYLAIDEILSNDYLFSIWVYAETNGVGGLQRDDDYCYFEGWTPETADTVVF